MRARQVATGIAVGVAVGVGAFLLPRETLADDARAKVSIDGMSAEVDVRSGSGSGGAVTGADFLHVGPFWVQRGAVEPPEDLGYHATRVVHAITDLAERT